jgi:hypothetical protein
MEQRQSRVGELGTETTDVDRPVSHCRRYTHWPMLPDMKPFVCIDVLSHIRCAVSSLDNQPVASCQPEPYRSCTDHPKRCRKLPVSSSVQPLDEQLLWPLPPKCPFFTPS